MKREPSEATEHLLCRKCNFVLPKGAEFCPSCGEARRRPKGKAVQVEGELELIDVVDGKGRKLPYDGDWWPEICAVACQLSPHYDKARRIALAKYKDIFGRWPKKQFEFTDREPHPAVRKYTHNRWQRYKIAQRKAKDA